MNGLRGSRFPRPWPRRRERRVAFVLSGGGVLGAVQVGQLQALHEAEIAPDLIVGCSVGAINGAAVAADASGQRLDELRTGWLGLRSEHLFPGSRVRRALSIVWKGDHLYSNSGIRRLVEMLPIRAFEEMQCPLEVVAANLRTGREQWFNTGPVAPAILASTALPGVYPPVAVDGELYVDGGVVNNVPISRAIELGATKIYVLTCGTPRPAPRPIRRPLDVLLQAVQHTRAARVEIDVARYAPHAEIELLPAPDAGWVRYNDLSKTAFLIERARTLAGAHLAGAPATV